MNILGVIVKTLPSSNLDRVKNALVESGLCDVFTAENGKIIITIEGIDDTEALGKLRAIEAMDGVIASDLIHIANENPEEIGDVDLDSINSEKDADTILYSGSVHNWISKNGY